MFKNNKKKKQNKKQNNNQKKGKGPVFVIEKDGKAYFKDKKLTMVCRPYKVMTSQKYPGYMYEFDYTEKLEWFKRFVALMVVNGGEMRFVGIKDLDEFNNLGGEPINITNAEKIDTKKLRKMMK